MLLMALPDTSSRARPSDAAVEVEKLWATGSELGTRSHDPQGEGSLDVLDMHIELTRQASAELLQLACAAYNDP